MRLRILLSLLGVLLLAGVLAPMARAAEAPQTPAAACLSTDRFSGSVAAMEHFANCNHIHYDLYTMAGGTVADGVVDGARPARPSAGPSCQWQTKHILEICYQRGVGHLICAQYWSGSYYPYHCGPVAAYNLTHAQSLWSVVSHAFSSHAAKACVRGTVGGVVTGTILKVAGSATGIGILASLAGGCVGGLITYFWRI